MSFIEQLFYRIYRLPYLTVLLLIVCAVLLWAFLASKIGKKHPKGWQMTNAVLALFLLYTILYYTVLRRVPHSSAQVIFTPFASLQKAKQQSEIYRALTMNIFLFCPVGLLVSQLFSGRHRIVFRILFTVAAGMLISLTVESLQFFLLRGDAETDDLITNSIGTFIGALTVPCTAMLEKIGAKR